MKIKNTLNIGKTKFPMRGNLPVNELRREKIWADNKLYEARQKLNEGKPTFILHDGPPYANGNIHIGHAMNKISKDIIVRYKSMNGFRSPFIPGWDTHGLPIEQQLTKMGKDRKAVGPVIWRKMADEFAHKQVKKQMNDFKRLGIAADWDHPYLTLMPEFEAAQIRVFGTMAKKGYIYKGKKPVFWSWSSESALALSEIEYHDITSPTAYYAEQVKDGKGLLDNDTYFVVWTTTPWTIPGSRGISVNAEFKYSQVKPAGSNKKYIIATELLAHDAELFGWEKYEVLAEFTGKDLEYITAQHPFYEDIDLLVMLADFVTLDAGTGLVHTAPGFGEDDFYVGQKYKIEVAVPVDYQGKMTKEAGVEFEGTFYEDANEISLKKLAEQGNLLKQEDITHSYPFDWRTKKPVIYRAVPQWFASVADFRDDLLSELDNVTFSPEWGKKRLYNMLKDRGDWVISRQRVWGVPLPIFYAEDGTAILDPDVIEHVADLVAENGSTYWFEKSAQELLPVGYTNEHSPNGLFTKENDIMDVWFDSGTSHQGVLATRENLEFPADLVLEGSDQYRGWFNSSIITSVAATGHAPYKSVLSQGFTLDANGEKMSKSIGNTIEPSEITDSMGADIIRLWVSTVDTSQDVRVSMDGFKQTSESYRKIRNTMRFLLANTSDFDPTQDQIAFNDMTPVDQYFYIRFNELVAEIKTAYDRYDFQVVNKTLMNFINVDLSAFYLDFNKDVLYVEAPKGQLRRSVQTVLYKVLVDLNRLMLPILPHTSEEIFEYLPYEEGDFAYLTEMPDVEKLEYDGDLLNRWSKFMDVRSAVNKALEVARNNDLIGKPAEAAVTLYLQPEQRELIDSLGQDIRVLLLVSQLQLKNIDEKAVDVDRFDEYFVLVEHAAGEMSPRDRMYHLDLGQDLNFPMLSKHEAQIIRDNFPEALDEGLE